MFHLIFNVRSKNVETVIPVTETNAYADDKQVTSA
jgi:hypothetical protein